MSTIEAAPAAAVVVREVSKRYVVGSGRRRRTVEAVRSASLTIPRGSCLAVVGESGSGKTTLARMLVGLESADAGSMSVNGAEVGRRASRRERRLRSRDIQMVFQDPQGALNRRLPVRVAVTEVLAMHTDLDARGREERCAELFEAVVLLR
jgi:ABC-type glutathione transport system ATPase component